MENKNVKLQSSGLPLVSVSRLLNLKLFLKFFRFSLKFHNLLRNFFSALCITRGKKCEKKVPYFSKIIVHNEGKDFIYSSRALLTSYFSEK